MTCTLCGSALTTTEEGRHWAALHQAEKHAPLAAPRVRPMCGDCVDPQRAEVEQRIDARIREYFRERGG
jgi:hypothetical protein